MKLNLEQAIEALRNGKRVRHVEGFEIALSKNEEIIENEPRWFELFLAGNDPDKEEYFVTRLNGNKPKTPEIYVREIQDKEIVIDREKFREAVRNVQVMDSKTLEDELFGKEEDVER